MWDGFFSMWAPCELHRARGLDLQLADYHDDWSVGNEIPNMPEQRPLGGAVNCRCMRQAIPPISKDICKSPRKADKEDKAVSSVVTVATVDDAAWLQVPKEFSPDQLALLGRSAIKKATPAMEHGLAGMTEALHRKCAEDMSSDAAFELLLQELRQVEFSLGRAATARPTIRESVAEPELPLQTEGSLSKSSASTFKAAPKKLKVVDLDRVPEEGAGATKSLVPDVPPPTVVPDLHGKAHLQDSGIHLMRSHPVFCKSLRFTAEFEDPEPPPSITTHAAKRRVDNLDLPSPAATLRAFPGLPLKHPPSPGKALAEATAKTPWAKEPSLATVQAETSADYGGIVAADATPLEDTPSNAGMDMDGVDSATLEEKVPLTSTSFLAAVGSSPEQLVRRAPPSGNMPIQAPTMGPGCVAAA